MVIDDSEIYRLLNLEEFLQRSSTSSVEIGEVGKWEIREECSPLGQRAASYV